MRRMVALAQGEDPMTQLLSIGSVNTYAYDPTQTYEDGTPQVGFEAVGEFSSRDFKNLLGRVKGLEMRVEALELLQPPITP